MLVLQAAGLPSVSETQKTQALIDVDYLQKSLAQISYVWPVATHTSDSLKELLKAAQRPRQPPTEEQQQQNQQQQQQQQQTQQQQPPQQQQPQPPQPQEGVELQQQQ